MEAVWFLLGYVFGSFPSGYVISQLKGINIRELGSGNIGTANVYRVLGGRYAAITAFLDLFKGLVPVLLAGSHYYGVFAGVGALLGSIFSVFLGFRGGKGFASLAGSWIGLSYLTGNWYVLVISLVGWLTVVILTRITSLANIVAVNLAVPLSACTHITEVILFSIVSQTLILYSHRENIKRLLEGRERRLDHRVRPGERW